MHDSERLRRSQAEELGELEDHLRSARFPFDDAFGGGSLQTLVADMESSEAADRDARHAAETLEEREAGRRLESREAELQAETIVIREQQRARTERWAQLAQRDRV
jgi:hypothetical protein